MNAAMEWVESSIPSVPDEHAVIVVTVNGKTRRPREAALIYAENALRTWAKWARENRESLELPTISMLYKAMQAKQVRMKTGKAKTQRREGPALTAYGRETVSFIPTKTSEPPEAVIETDDVVGELPATLHEIIVADYFTYGPIEARCKKTRYKLARYSQLLEAAKYAVFAGLKAKACSRSDID